MAFHMVRCDHVPAAADQAEVAQDDHVAIVTVARCCQPPDRNAPVTVNRPRIVTLMTVALVGMMGLPANADEPEHVVYTTRATTFNVNANATRHADHVSLGAGGFAWRHSKVPDASVISVTARATTCPGRPNLDLTLSIDGSEVGRWSVGSPDWIDVEAPVALTAGGHWITVAATSDGPDARRCTRSIDVTIVHLGSPEAINTATAGSRCVPTDGGLGWSPPEADIMTSILGPDAPAYYEIGLPTGDLAGTPPKGVMLIFHGGGWITTGPQPVAQMRTKADVWRARGWMTVNASYRGCGDSVADALWFHDTVSDWLHWLPLCTFGDSAGAHLALMVAGLRPDVDCAVGHGAPTDLVSLATQEAWIPPGGADERWSPMALHHAAVAAFGQSALAQMSPITHAALLADSRVVVATAVEDQIIPLDQGRTLEAAIRAVRVEADVETWELNSGSTPWVHALVSAEDLAELSQAEADLADRASMGASMGQIGG